MKKFLKHITLYGLLVFILLNTIAWCSLYFLRNSSFYKPSFLTHEVIENDFDYIVIGSSIGLTTLNTILIDSLTDKRGLNLSIDDTSIASNYLMLHHFYENGKKTKYCILAISHWDLAVEKPTLNDNDYRFLPYFYEDYVYNYYKALEPDFFKPLALSHYFPAIGVCYYNTEIFYPSIVAAIQPNKRNRFDENGNYFYPELGKIQRKKWSTIELSWKNPYVEKMQKLCKENNTALIFYQAPIFNTKIINSNREINFINHADVIEKEDYFFDEIHVNQYGRAEASTIFAKELMKNYVN